MSRSNLPRRRSSLKPEMKGPEVNLEDGVAVVKARKVQRFKAWLSRQSSDTNDPDVHRHLFPVSFNAQSIKDITLYIQALTPEKMASKNVQIEFLLVYLSYHIMAANNKPEIINAVYPVLLSLLNHNHGADPKAAGYLVPFIISCAPFMMDVLVNLIKAAIACFRRAVVIPIIIRMLNEIAERGIIEFTCELLKTQTLATQNKQDMLTCVDTLMRTPACPVVAKLEMLRVALDGVKIDEYESVASFSSEKSSPFGSLPSEESLNQLVLSVSSETTSNDLIEIYRQMQRLKKLPEAPIDQLFKRSLELLGKAGSARESSYLTSIINFINEKADPHEVFRLYVECAEKEVADEQILESNYQSFILCLGQPLGSEFPHTISQSLNGGTRRDISFIFDLFGNWQTIYDGLQRLAELVKNEPDVDVSKYIDALSYSQQIYVEQGLRDINSQECDEKITHFIDRWFSIPVDSPSHRASRGAADLYEQCQQILNSDQQEYTHRSNPQSPGRFRRPSITPRSIV